MADSLTLDNGLYALSRDINAAAEDLARIGAPTLQRIGDKVLDRSREIASEHSTSIPPTIRGGLHGRYEYRGQAGSDDVPLAGLFELGNKGSKALSNSWKAMDEAEFRHPTYGHEPWVYQFRYPFFRPALKENREWITEELTAVWDEVFRTHRLGPEAFGFGFMP